MNIVLNEERIRNIVSEAILPLLTEAIDLRLQMGKGGHLTDANLLTPEEFLKDTYTLYDKVKKSKKTLNIDRVFSKDPGYLIWKNYVASMLGSFNQEDDLDDQGNQRFDDEGNVIQKPILHGFKPQDREQQYPKYARAFFDWLKDIRHGKMPSFGGGGKCPIMAFQAGNNYIFGHWNNGFFIAAYISMASPMGLLTLLTEICKYDNVIFAITLDMAQSLKKLGFLTDGQIHQVEYHHKMVDKMIFATSPTALNLAVMVHGMAASKMKAKATKTRKK